MDGKTVEFPRSLLSEKIIAIMEVYIDDDLSLASMPLDDGKLSSKQNESTCALSSTANYGAEQESSLVKLSFPIHTLPITASIFCGSNSGALRHIKSHVLCRPPFVRTLGPLDRECGQALMNYHDLQCREMMSSRT